MTSSKHTKRALLASVLSMLLCASMLVGSTFAWFTDSVTSGTNTIVAGNLDVTLKYGTPSADKTAFEGDWKDVTGVDSLFTGNLWEPGHTEVVYLEIANAGSLALKYQFSMNFTETGSVNVYDDEFKLSTYLKYAVVEQGEATPVPYADRAAALTAAGAGTDLAAYTEESKPMLSGEKRYVALVVWMPETVGNDANYKTGEAAPTIDLGIELLASQTPHEEDSFGNQYDVNAAYPVTNAAELNKALTNGGIVAIANDIDVEAKINPELTKPSLVIDTFITKDTTLILEDGKTIKAVQTAELGHSVPLMYAVEGKDAVFNISGNGTIDAGKWDTENGVYAINVKEGGTVNITGGTFKATETAVQVQDGTLNISGGTFISYGTELNEYLINAIDSNWEAGTAKIVITGGTFVNFNPAAVERGGSYLGDGYTVEETQDADGNTIYTVVAE